MFGSAIVYSGIVTATAGLILFIKPIERLHVTSRVARLDMNLKCNIELPSYLRPAESDQLPALRPFIPELSRVKSIFS